jgi:hypothetical protein
MRSSVRRGAVEVKKTALARTVAARGGFSGLCVESEARRAECAEAASPVVRQIQRGALSSPAADVFASAVHYPPPRVRFNGGQLQEARFENQCTYFISRYNRVFRLLRSTCKLARRPNRFFPPTLNGVFELRIQAQRYTYLELMLGSEKP